MRSSAALVQVTKVFLDKWGWWCFGFVGVMACLGAGGRSSVAGVLAGGVPRRVQPSGDLAPRDFFRVKPSGASLCGCWHHLVLFLPEMTANGCLNSGSGRSDWPASPRAGSTIAWSAFCR